MKVTLRMGLGYATDFLPSEGTSRPCGRNHNRRTDRQDRLHTGGLLPDNGLAGYRVGEALCFRLDRAVVLLVDHGRRPLIGRRDRRDEYRQSARS